MRRALRSFVATLLVAGCAANVADTGGADYGIAQPERQHAVRAPRACTTPECELAQKQYPTCLRECTKQLARTTSADAADPVATCEARCEGLPDPLCERGISSEGACCPAGCRDCGGLGCSQRPGGVNECCVLRIQSAGTSCLRQAGPCLL